MQLTRGFGVRAQAEVHADRLQLLTGVFCLVSILSQTSLILVSLGKLPPVVPLFYSRTWGEAMLAPTLMLLFLPATLALVFLVNFSLAIFVLNSRFLTRTLLLFTLLVAFLTLYDTAKIISLLI